MDSISNLMGVGNGHSDERKGRKGKHMGRKCTATHSQLFECVNTQAAAIRKRVLQSSSADAEAEATACKTKFTDTSVEHIARRKTD